MYSRTQPKTANVEKITQPRRKVKLPKRLEQAEVDALLAAPNQAAITGLRNRCMLELMYRAGLRVGEVCALKNRDLNIKKREVYIWAGKGGDRTAGYANDTQLDVLLGQWMQRRKHETKKSEYFFCTIQGGQVSTAYMQQMTRRMAKRAKLEKLEVTPHKLRHTFATEFLENGGSIQHLQLLLGHKNVSTTQIYMHVQPKDALAAVHQQGKARRT